MTTGKTIALTRWLFVDKVVSLLFNMLSRLVITFLPRSKRLLISWLQSPFAVILEPPKIKSVTISSSICHEVMGPDAMILVFWMLSFKPTFSLSSFTFIKRLSSSSSLSAISSVQFSRSVVSDSLQPRESQHAKPPCPSPTPRVHSGSHPSSQWCHPAISSSVDPFSCPQPLPASESFLMSQLCMRWPKYWDFSFSIIPSKEYPELIFKMDWLDLLAVQGTLKSLIPPTPHFKSINSSALSLLHSPALTSTHDH